MTVKEQILQRLENLPEEVQLEILDFVEYLEARKAKAKDDGGQGEWGRFSLSQAMQGMESEPQSYSRDDIKETF